MTLHQLKCGAIKKKKVGRVRRSKKWNTGHGLDMQKRIIRTCAMQLLESATIGAFGLCASIRASTRLHESNIEDIGFRTHIIN